jgi:purine-cytosine permease-like protein
VLFGLSFQAGVWAIVLGVLVGALILAPMGLFGPINGTNNAVSSGRTLACTGGSSARSCRC